MKKAIKSPTKMRAQGAGKQDIVAIYAHRSA
jgi:hypothetical protein